MFEYDLSSLLQFDSPNGVVEAVSTGVVPNGNTNPNITLASPAARANPAELTTEENELLFSGATVLHDTIEEEVPELVTMNLAERALLMKLSIGKPKTEIGLDPQQRKLISDKVASEIARVGIKMIAKEDMEEINKAAAKASAPYYLYTIPWDDRGWRLGPDVHYQKINSEVLQAQNEMLDAAQRLAGRRDELEAKFHAELRKQGLDALIPVIEFPSAEDLEKACKVKFEGMPIANSDDIRLRHVDPEQIKAIAANAEAQLQSKIRAGLSEAVFKLKDYVSNVAEQCAKEKPRIYDTLIGNIQKQVEALRSFNFYDIPEINRILKAVETQLTSLSCDDLRDSQAARADAVKSARSVLTDLDNFRPLEA